MCEISYESKSKIGMINDIKNGTENKPEYDEIIKMLNNTAEQTEEA